MASRKIEDLYVSFQPLAKAILDAGKFGEWEAFITDGFRSIAEQNALFAQGRSKPGKIVTNAKGGESFHNFGLAIDVAFKNKKNEIKYEVGWLSLMAGKVKSLGIEWGGNWASFPDNPHFQFTGGLTLKQVQAGKRPGMPKLDDEFISKWNGKFLIAAKAQGQVYYVFNGKRYYVSPLENLQSFAKKFATGFSNEDLERIPIGS